MSAPAKHPPMDQSNLLASILVRYPEIGSLKLIGASRCLRLGFFMTEGLSEKKFEQFVKHMTVSIEAFSKLMGFDLKLFDIRISRDEAVSMMEMDRDMDTISLQELSLITGILREQFQSKLICGEEGSEDGEESQWYDEFIHHMLDEIHQGTLLQELIAFREGNRVLVYDRSVE